MDRHELDMRMKILEARALVLIMQQAPVKTGKLMRSIKTERNNKGGFRVYVDTSLAPHMKYTENPWTDSKWNGRKNPNEGWFKEAGRSLARASAATLDTNLIKR